MELSPQNIKLGLVKKFARISKADFSLVEC
jgi:hypothetical protein